MSFWRRKLLAFLHDPPSKAIDIANRREVARALTLAAMAIDEEALKWTDHAPDHHAAAADRFPLPGSSSGLRSKFRGDHATPSCPEIRSDTNFELNCTDFVLAMLQLGFGCILA
jgi:hypothetical protein